MYNPKIIPLREDISYKVEMTDWDEIAPALTGWDIYVDVDGKVGFYEGNSSPFGLTDYEDLHGGDMNEALVKQLAGKNVIGINVAIGLDYGPERNLASKHAKQILTAGGLEVITANQGTTRFDMESGKFYFQNGDRNYMDVLLNRCPGAQRNLREQVPRRHWARVPSLSPIAHTLILSNKAQTQRALERFGLDMPVAYVVHNDAERKEAMAKVMEHIRAEHPNYEAPYIFIKPVSGTGARRIKIFQDDKSIPTRPIRYPCLVGERISVAGFFDEDGTHVVDTRMFYCGGHASKAVVRVAPLPIHESRDGKSFRRDAFRTSLCRNGVARTMQPSAEKVLNQYVLAATIALDNAAKRYAGRKFK